MSDAVRREPSLVDLAQDENVKLFAKALDSLGEGETVEDLLARVSNVQISEEELAPYQAGAEKFDRLMSELNNPFVSDQEKQNVRGMDFGQGKTYGALIEAKGGLVQSYIAGRTFAPERTGSVADDSPSGAAFAPPSTVGTEVEPQTAAERARRAVAIGSSRSMRLPVVPGIQSPRVAEASIDSMLRELSGARHLEKQLAEKIAKELRLVGEKMMMHHMFADGEDYSKQYNTPLNKVENRGLKERLEDLKRAAESLGDIYKFKELNAAFDEVEYIFGDRKTFLGTAQTVHGAGGRTPPKVKREIALGKFEKHRAEALARGIARKALEAQLKDTSPSEEQVRKLAEILSDRTPFVNTAFAAEHGIGSIIAHVAKGCFLDTRTASRRGIYTNVAEATAPQPIWEQHLIQAAARAVIDGEGVDRGELRAALNREVRNHQMVLGAKAIRRVYHNSVVKTAVDMALGEKGLGAEDRDHRFAGIAGHYARHGTGAGNGLNAHVVAKDADFAMPSHKIAQMRGKGGRKRKQVFVVSHTLEIAIRKMLAEQLSSMPDKVLHEVQADLPMLVEHAILTCGASNDKAMSLVSANGNAGMRAEQVVEMVMKSLPTKEKARQALKEGKSANFEPEQGEINAHYELMCGYVGVDIAATRGEYEKLKTQVSERVAAAQTFSDKVIVAVRGEIPGFDMTSSVRRMMTEQIMREMNDDTFGQSETPQKFVDRRMQEMSAQLQKEFYFTKNKTLDVGRVGGAVGIKAIAEKSKRDNGLIVTKESVRKVVESALAESKYALDEELTEELIKGMRAVVGPILDDGRFVKFKDVKDLVKAKFEAFAETRDLDRGGAKPKLTEENKDRARAEAEGAGRAQSAKRDSRNFRDEVANALRDKVRALTPGGAAARSLDDAVRMLVDNAEAITRKGMPDHYKGMSATLKAQLLEDMRENLRNASDISLTEAKMEEMGEALAVVLSHADIARSDSRSIFRRRWMPGNAHKHELNRTSLGYGTDEWQEFEKACVHVAKGEYEQAFKEMKMNKEQERTRYFNVALTPGGEVQAASTAAAVSQEIEPLGPVGPSLARKVVREARKAAGNTVEAIRKTVERAWQRRPVARAGDPEARTPPRGEGRGLGRGRGGSVSV